MPRGRFTLDGLASVMRGMPRDALILIRLPDGRVVDIDHVKPTYVREAEGELRDGAAGDSGRYAIVLVPKGEGEN